MNKSIKILFLIIFVMGLSLFSFAANEGNKVAMVRMKRGSAEASLNGQGAQLKKGEWIREGSIIKTGDKSFVKLSFIDKSSMNIGPNSEIVIEKFGNKEAGVINVLSGKIRSQVSKNYLNMDKDKSKLFVKSKSAVMGIRGTDFMFTASKTTGASTAVLFEGSVVFNKLNAGESSRDLESIVNNGRRIQPGQFSVARNDMKKATIPSKMSSKQFYRLEKNKDFVADSPDKNVANKTPTKSVVPPGLTGTAVKSEAIAALPGEMGKPKENLNIETTKGFNKGEDIKPADGSMVHIESGTVIPMGGDSHFDANTNEWTSSTNGSVGVDGEYVPPAKHEITDKGDLLRIDPNTGEVLKVSTEIAPVDSTAEFNALPGTVIERENDNKEGPTPAGTVDPLDSSTQLKPPPTPEGCDTCNRPGSVFNPAGDRLNQIRTKGRTRVRGTFR